MQKSQLAGYQAPWAWTLAFVMTNNFFHYCLSAIISTRDIFADICSLPTQCTLVKRKLLYISRIEGTALYLFPRLLACLFLFVSLHYAGDVTVGCLIRAPTCSNWEISEWPCLMSWGAVSWWAWAVIFCSLFSISVTCVVHVQSAVSYHTFNPPEKFWISQSLHSLLLEHDTFWGVLLRHYTVYSAPVRCSEFIVVGPHSLP